MQMKLKMKYNSDFAHPPSKSKASVFNDVVRGNESLLSVENWKLDE
jgi:hypothetical protein